jgi:hypothetical protein
MRKEGQLVEATQGSSARACWQPEPCPSGYAHSFLYVTLDKRTT